MLPLSGTRKLVEGTDIKTRELEATGIPLFAKATNLPLGLNLLAGSEITAVGWQQE